MERTMGKVQVTARIENWEDLFKVQRGLLKPEQVRSVEVADALVDPSATTLSIPKWMVAQLGLRPLDTLQARTSSGPVRVRVCGLVQLTVQGRDWRGDAIEVPDDYPVQIGKIPLGELDFVVDLQSQRLIGNPEHSGEQMVELY